MELTIYTSNSTGNAKNCLYPNKVIVTNVDELKKAVKLDHVCAEFNNNYRSKDNYILGDCDVFDCDNDHSDNPAYWIHPEDYEFMLDGVSYAVVPSRNNEKIKNNKSARPRHHIYFPHREFATSKECEEFKKKVHERFSFFDDGALDSARFIYGNDAKDIIWYEGDKTLDDLIDSYDLFAEFDELTSKIQEGSRNSTMSHIAGKIIKRYGNTDESFKMFLEQADKCYPPLEEVELRAIWQSAIRFGMKVSSQDGYIPPEDYNQDFDLMPLDLSDVGQAVILAREYDNVLRHSPSTEYLFYNGSYWEESKAKAQGLSQDLTSRQLNEAETEMKKCLKEMKENGAMKILDSTSAKKALAEFDKVQAHSYAKYEKAMMFQKYAVKRRDSSKIWATLKEVIPFIQIEQNELDKNEFYLNTPSSTYNLRTGTAHEHVFSDFITKQTTVDPSDEGMDIWQESLNTFFQNDAELISYVQKIVGLSAIGKVYIEALIIAYGEGRNGKSTFWNTISKVLGTYSGTMSADILTVGCRRNVKPELAEAKGKRLLIAAELEEGMRMNTSNVKQLCSTDEITAEKKFKSPFSYTPSHTLVLYTNHLPKVGAIDKGTWRRLIVIPFNAVIEGSDDIKNYSDYLFKNAGSAVLKWILDGAKEVINANFQIIPPKVVKDAMDKYQEDNDWFNHFIEECCDVDATFTEKSGDLYSEYRSYCARTGEFTRSTTDFYTALQNENYKRKRTAKGAFVYGLRLKSEFSQ